MKYHFDPDEMRVLGKAFETAWRALEKETSASSSEALRDHIGRAIVDRAKTADTRDGSLDATRLASYAAYQGRRFMGRTVASITVGRNKAET